ncbi:OmpH family outer membrane protein [Mesohalobacter halotolerans]|uniref:OmpH family outer membrane protein n=1 Tax=Mesohalobacter halotolerans TaxID=1883405 RepID=A0A4U5TQ52_9FLAO|nr:OmpH family outer membrane protein [Mesohalobacter halotolerans]MBS3737634.1 OmpH family outer membrane protein [Psychroflexus sp.]TKS55464.1 OmpH family outer membrane protein [Mesohalobacter halotolerans]
MFNSKLSFNNKIFGLFLIILIFFSFQVQRGLSIGYIDMEYILDNIPEYRQASQMLEQKIQDWKGEIAIKQTEIDNLKEQLENERPLLTPELIEEKEDEIAYLQEQLLKYQEAKFGASGEFIVQKRQLIQPIEDQVFNAVQEIGRVRNYDFIFENSAEALMLFSAERHDISDRVLKMINRSARSERRDEKEKEKNPLDEMKDEPYKSVKDAKEDKAKEEEREKEISERERKRDSIREARKRIRDSIRNARQEAFEKRREEAQRRRDSIRKARENKK